MKKLSQIGLFLVVLLAACTPTSQEDSDIRIELIDSNVRRTYVYNEAVSVGEFLDEIEVEIGDLDRVEPRPFTQIEDGMVITIVRVTEETRCFEEELPFQTRRIPADALDPGVEELFQAGRNGTLQTCERCISENGVEVSCTPNSQTILQPALEEIIYFGTGTGSVPVPIDGKLAYISNGQAWLFEGNTRNRRPLTTSGTLDGRVFDLSADGRRVLFTLATPDESDPPFSNELWAILDIDTPNPVRLLPDNVILGQWFPGESYTVSYSTAEPRDTFPGWEAFNDVYVMRIDSQTGETISLDDIVRQNSVGVYTYWGANYVWSPDGENLAWSRADSVGLVDLETGDFITLLTFPHFDQAIVSGWVWQPEIVWSQDSQVLITTVHGAPFGGETPINSVVFNVAAIMPERDLILDNLINRSGIWAAPRYSPIRQDSGGFPTYEIAYLQAREPLNSLGGEYDLMVVDRDASNPRPIFPPQGRLGIRPFDEEQPTEFVWSPSGTHIAVIYQGNLWVVEVATGLAQQLTTDGRASHPRWTN